MRLLSSSMITLALLAMPAFASAHEVKEKPKPEISISDLKLPTEAEIEDIIDQMPDLNALMGGMLNVVQDEDIQDSLKEAGKALSQSVEKSGIMDMDIDIKNGELPDLNNLMATILRMTGDEDVMGEMLGVVTELQKSVEENFDEDMLKPKKD